MKIGLLMVSPKAASVLMQGLSAGQDDGSVAAHEALALEYELSKIAGHCGDVYLERTLNKNKNSNPFRSPE